jgi:hypothetical protein
MPNIAGRDVSDICSWNFADLEERRRRHFPLKTFTGAVKFIQDMGNDKPDGRSGRQDGR